MTQALPDASLADGAEAAYECLYLSGCGEQLRQNVEIRQARTCGSGHAIGRCRLMECLDFGGDAPIARAPAADANR
jgi:hypothetical protein